MIGPIFLTFENKQSRNIKTALFLGGGGNFFPGKNWKDCFALFCREAGPVVSILSVLRLSRPSILGGGGCFSHGRGQGEAVSVSLAEKNINLSSWTTNLWDTTSTLLLQKRAVEVIIHDVVRTIYFMIPCMRVSYSVYTFPMRQPAVMPGTRTLSPNFG